MKYVWMILIFLALPLVAAESNMVGVQLVNQDPDPVMAGDVVELRIGFENKGEDDVSAVTLRFDEVYPFTFIQDNELSIQQLSSYQQGKDMRIEKIKIKIDSQATAGDYDLGYILDYNNIEFDSDMSISITAGDHVEITNINKSSFTPGEQSEVTFTVTNVGSGMLRNVIFSWENKDEAFLPVGNDNSYYITELQPGDSTDIIFDMMAGTQFTDGVYPINLFIEYEEDGNVKTTSTTAGMYLGGETNFEVAFSEVSSGEYSFSVANIGSNPAYSVLVKAPFATGGKTSIIGNLDSGDYTVASFTMNGGEETQILIEYTDTKGKRHIVEKTVEITAMPDGITGTPGSGRGMNATQLKTDYSMYYIVAIILLGIAVIYLYKKRK